MHSCTFLTVSISNSVCVYPQAHVKVHQSHDTQAPKQQTPSPPPPLPLQSPPKLLMPEAAAAAVPSHLLPPHLRPHSDQPHAPQLLHREAATLIAPSQPPSPQSSQHHSSSTQPQLPQLQPQLSWSQSRNAAAAAAAAAAPEAVRPPPSLLPAWRGQLAKSGMVKCKAECLSTGSADASVPWPTVLDVRARVVVAHALEQPKQHPPQHIVIRCVVSTDDAKNQHHFHQFCEYLTEKQRAGVVNFGSGSNKHTMFLIPGSPDVFQQMHVRDPHRECLIAVMILKRSE